MLHAYMAIKDKEIERRQKQVYEHNKKLIEVYNNLPWYKKIFDTHTSQAITTNWVVFNEWMTKHMEKQRQVADRLEPITLSDYINY